MFTQEEEDILRLMITELQTRKKLDLVRAEKDVAMRTAINPLIAKTEADYKTPMDALQVDFDTAEQAIEDKFK